MQVCVQFLAERPQGPEESYWCEAILVVDVFLNAKQLQRAECSVLLLLIVDEVYVCVGDAYGLVVVVFLWPWLVEEVFFMLVHGLYDVFEYDDRFFILHDLA